MDSFGLLAQALGVAYAAGLNVPATVAILGLAQQRGWIGHLPAGLDVVGNPWIIGLAGVLYLIEFLITLLPGLASLWETVQTAVRPAAAAVLAAATVYHLDPMLVLPAVLLGGGLAATTHGTKLGGAYTSRDPDRCRPPHRAHPQTVGIGPMVSCGFGCGQTSTPRKPMRTNPQRSRSVMESEPLA